MSNMNSINQTLSIFIPRVFNCDANENFIKNILGQYGLVDRIDFVQKSGYFHAFVHFQLWYNNDTNIDVQKKLESKTPIYLVCNQETTFGRYIILLKNNKPMRRSEVQMEKRIKELETELEKVKQDYNYTYQQLQRLCNQNASESDAMKRLGHDISDYVNSTNEEIPFVEWRNSRNQDNSINMYIHSDEYKNHHGHDEVYDMDLVE